MPPEERKRAYREDMLLATAMVVMGVVISGLSLVQLKTSRPEMAQATPPLQSTPTPTPQNSPPAESKPGGERLSRRYRFLGFDREPIRLHDAQF